MTKRTAKTFEDGEDSANERFKVLIDNEMRVAEEQVQHHANCNRQAVRDNMMRWLALDDLKQCI